MGWNGSNGNSGLNANGNGGRASRPATQQTRKPNGSIRGLLALVIVVGLSAAVYFLFIGRDKTAPVRVERPKQVAKIPEVTNAVPTRESVMQARKEYYRQQALERQAAIDKAKREYVKKPGQLQMPDGKILTFPPPKEGEIRKVYAYGHLYECDHLGNFKDVKKRNLFHTAFEANLFALATSSKPFIPAFLVGLDEKDVRRMLEKEYKPIGDETDEEKAQLEAYDNFRGMVLDYMDQGGKFDDIVKDQATFERKQRTARSVSMREILTAYKEGRVAEAKDLAAAANEMMKKQGYSELRIPAHVQQAFDSISGN